MTGDAREVLEFWFGARGSPEHGTRREVWFKEGRSIDDEVRRRFLNLHEAAAAGVLDAWRDDPRACLALVIALDQFPRHMFRDTPRAYATDPEALATATDALDRGYDLGLSIIERNFVYLPFSHAEDLAAQRRSVELRRALPEHGEKERSVTRAVEHMEVVERFGRFPHRNDIIGRASTPEEVAFLVDNPDAWFAKYRKRGEAGP